MDATEAKKALQNIAESIGVDLNKIRIQGTSIVLAINEKQLETLEALKKKNPSLVDTIFAHNLGVKADFYAASPRIEIKEIDKLDIVEFMGFTSRADRANNISPLNEALNGTPESTQKAMDLWEKFHRVDLIDDKPPQGGLEQLINDPDFAKQVRDALNANIPPPKPPEGTQSPPGGKKPGEVGKDGSR